MAQIALSDGPLLLTLSFRQVQFAQAAELATSLAAHTAAAMTFDYPFGRADRGGCHPAPDFEVAA